MKDQLTFDIECYVNYFLIMFKHVKSGKVLYFEKFNDSDLHRSNIIHLINKYELVSFNGLKYDAIVLEAALKGMNNASIQRVSKMVIEEKMQPWQIRKKVGLEMIHFDHIDLMEVAPGVGSLKIYGGRVHAPTLQDLPIEPDATILESDLPLMRKYCENDLDLTELLLKALETQLELRRTMSEDYDINLMSKSDAQIAEAVIKSDLKANHGIHVKKSKIESGTYWNYTPPTNISFKTEVLREIFELYKICPFIIGKQGGMEIKTGKYKVDLSTGEYELNKKGNKIELPHPLANKKFTIGDTPYKIAIGGLHSIEKKVSHTTEGGNYIIKEIDVESYYPRIILNNKIFPSHIGVAFLQIYNAIVNRRLKAKHAGHKVISESLKIVINGCYGKLASKYSFLYDPSALMHVTITGQLTLFMLIEALELEGIRVVSGNTDGIVVKYKPEQEGTVKRIVSEWEEKTNYKMEYTNYKGIYSRDVNNYIAVADDSVKAKGMYTNPRVKPNIMRKNPVNEICAEAARTFLNEGTPIEKTIRNCKDISRFVTIRTVNGGATYEGELVGKAVRWYYSKWELDSLYYLTNGNKVPRSDGAIPLMTLPDELPEDLDYDWYIAEANKFLTEIGVEHVA